MIVHYCDRCGVPCSGEETMLLCGDTPRAFTVHLNLCDYCRDELVKRLQEWWSAGPGMGAGLEALRALAKSVEHP